MEHLDTRDLLKLYEWMLLSRITEERMTDYHKHTPLPELPHAGIGQEAIAAGTVLDLRIDDQILPSLRTRGAFIFKGISSRTMMAGAFAKVTGAARGKNTSHHMGDPKVGVVAGSGVVAAHLPIAVGVALAAKLQKKDYVAVAYFGDGGSNRGDVHESMNMAAVMKLGVVFVCENNGYSISTPLDVHCAVRDIAVRAQGYGMPGVVVDGNDVLAVLAAAREAYARARAGEGPTLIECKTYRWLGHSERDPRDLRPAEEIAAWREKCPIKRLRDHLLSNGLADEATLDDIRAGVAAEVDDAIVFAEQSPLPPPEEAALHVYAEPRTDR
ncbi:thiamine pyrophosphate-dependent dehydrogenase E1 component subunit alpha [Rhodoplanes sp. TEM]|uniref:Thiamine pyrophosphate-dependent dehydrogenase E1 component subunit alpha n=1 Tax=Rhodoplanes tepidamans TaxID=200616 RepID=A0ABT5JHX0_RHOTP|nr:MULTISPECIES: thiamine pyrophosphate-dependent dehydrogenase E1 component subunit alpha [Rhodoplanes]MDC7788884.1 thiamine pyrophosphate-dependent dehydrogenase E1 component subunit alpha [Rhodoplanes tepidamans]MDC7987507.1 thiamine pyrophosphate-dependent dehydrogenase E1 component subunit alpha [Rhodoplanes sp. TEM]MDQ0355120.1 TPP-dependent pyruvate/acetoin dehydrogenase alpha subunit [Rhodoplanes tepidamans]